MLCCAADAARQQLADQIEQHTQKAKKARIDEAVAGTEVTLSKIIAVNAVELLGNFPPDLWKQLHTARKQVGLAALALTPLTLVKWAALCCLSGMWSGMLSSVSLPLSCCVPAGSGVCPQGAVVGADWCGAGSR